MVRFNPLGLNEGATPGAQLWVLMSQIQQELELRSRSEVLVTDRAVVDNYAYYLRVTGGEDPFDVEPLVRKTAGQIAANAPLTLKSIKLIIRELTKEPARRDAKAIGESIRTCFESEDYREGVRAFLEKRRPVFRGH